MIADVYKFVSFEIYILMRQYCMSSLYPYKWKHHCIPFLIPCLLSPVLLQALTSDDHHRIFENVDKFLYFHLDEAPLQDTFSRILHDQHFLYQLFITSHLLTALFCLFFFTPLL